MADNKIQVLLEVDDKGTASLQKFQRTVAQTGKDGERAFTGMSTASSNLARGVASLAASYASLQGVRALISIADQYTQLEGRLRLVTASTAELAAVETQLYAVAQQTRVGYAETVELYTRLARATKDTGISQTELMSTVQAVNQALIVSGATTTEANAALIQFSQGMASGVLRGEELNSVMEQTPRIAQMIADGLGISTGQLREWGKEGKLTSDVVMPALLKSAGDVNREFGLMPTTVSQAGTVLANTLKSLVADANSGSGATAELAAAIIGVSTAVDANRENILSIFANIVTAAASAGQAILNIANSVKGFAAVAAGELSLKEFAGMGSSELTQWMKDYESGLQSLKDRVEDTAGALKKLREEDPDFVDEEALGRAELAYNAATKELSAFEQKGKEAAKASAALGGEQKKLATATTGTGTAAKTTAGHKKTLAKESTSAASAAKKLADEQERLAREAETTGRAMVEAATKTREMTAELSKALFDTSEAYDTLGITSRKSYEDQVKAATDAYERILSIEDLTDSERLRLREALQKRLIELEDGYRGKAEETIGAIGIAWEDLTEDTKQVLHDWVESAIKMEFDSIGEAFEGLAESILNVWIDLLAKMTAEWAMSGIMGLFSGSGFGGFAIPGLSSIPGIGKLFGGGTVGSLADWGLTAAGTSSVISGASSLLGGGAGSAAMDWGLNSFGVPALGGGAAAGAATLFGEQAAAGFVGGVETAMAGGLEWAAIPGKEFFGTGASQTAAAGGAGIGTAAAFGGMAAFAGGLYALASMTATPWQSITSPTLGIGVDMPIHGSYGESDARRRASTLLDIESGLYDPTAGGGGDTIGMGALAEFDLKPIIEDARGLLDILANQFGDGLAALALQLDGTVASTDALLDAATGYNVSLEQSAAIHDLAAQAVGGSESAMRQLRASLISLGMSEQQAETAMLGLVSASGQGESALYGAASAVQSMTGAVRTFSSTPLKINAVINTEVAVNGGKVGGSTTTTSTSAGSSAGGDWWNDSGDSYMAPHAVGGIFVGPTLIPSIAGGKHLVGEAGPEAILPLPDANILQRIHDRLADGGSGRPVQIVFQVDGKTFFDQVIAPHTDAMIANKASRGMLGVRARF